MLKKTSIQYIGITALLLISSFQLVQASEVSPFTKDNAFIWEGIAGKCDVMGEEGIYYSLQLNAIEETIPSQSINVQCQPVPNSDKPTVSLSLTRQKSVLNGSKEEGFNNTQLSIYTPQTSVIDIPTGHFWHDNIEQFTLHSNENRDFDFFNFLDTKEITFVIENKKLQSSETIMFSLHDDSADFKNLFQECLEKSTLISKQNK